MKQVFGLCIFFFCISMLFGVSSVYAQVVPSGTLSVLPCVPGLGKSAADPKNSLICDAKVSWNTSGAQKAYVLISGDYPYDAANYPSGFVIAPALSGTNAVFWVTNGIYRASLYVNGDIPTQTSPGTGTKIKEVVFRISATSSEIISAAVPTLIPNKTTEWTQGGTLLTNFLNMYNGHVQVEPTEEYPYKMWFFGWAANLCNNPVWPNGSTACDAIFYARSRDGVSWQVYAGDVSGVPTFDATQNPAKWKAIISAQNVYYDQVHDGDPAVVKVNGMYYMVYSAVGFDKDGIEGGKPGDTDGYFNGIMGAVSSDGIHWERTTKPFFAAAGEYGGKDSAPGNMYHRPSMLYENGKFRIWFDYWVSDAYGLGMGYAEMPVVASKTNFLNGKWNIVRAGNNPMMVNWPNPNVIRAGNTYYSYADPMVDERGIWPSRKITEATSPDGIRWTVTGYVDPDSGCAAMHVPEAYVTKNKLTVTYGCQKGGDPYDYTYKKIRSISKVVDAPLAPVAPVRKGYVERFTKKAENLYTLTGWGCTAGVPTSVPVTIELGGVAWKNVMASSSSEAAVATACQSTGMKYRFNIPFDATMLKAYGGRKVTAKVFGTPLIAPSTLTVPLYTFIQSTTSPQGALSFTPCTPGLGKSSASLNNPSVCDQVISWSTANATSVRLVITGDAPYDTSSFPTGYVAGTGLSGTATFWVTAGTYTATLYSGTTTISTNLFTIISPEPEPPSRESGGGAMAPKNTLSQLASLLQALRALLGR